MQPLDIIEFKLTQFTFGPDREPSNVAAIYVNGKSFIDIAEEGNCQVRQRMEKRGWQEITYGQEFGSCLMS